MHEAHEARASIFARLTFGWVSPLLRRGRAAPLEPSDLFGLLAADATEANARRLGAAQRREGRESRERRWGVGG